jgi:hypothetical protein
MVSSYDEIAEWYERSVPMSDDPYFAAEALMGEVAGQRMRPGLWPVAGGGIWPTAFPCGGADLSANPGDVVKRRPLHAD